MPLLGLRPLTQSWTRAVRSNVIVRREVVAPPLSAWAATAGSTAPAKLFQVTEPSAQGNNTRWALTVASPLLVSNTVSFAEVRVTAGGTADRLKPSKSSRAPLNSPTSAFV